MKTTTRYLRLVIILLIIILTIESCSNSSETITKQNQSIPLTKPLMTATIANSAPTQNTLAPMPPFRTELSCWQMKQLKKGSSISGELITRYGNSGYYYWNINTFQAEPFADKRTVWLDLPPNRKFMPIYTPEKKVVITFPYKEPVTLNLPEGGYSLSYLLNGKILVAPYANLTTYSVDNKRYKEGVGYTAAYYLYDPKNNQLTEHTIFLPHFSYFAYGGASWAYIAYSPDGNYVLFRSELLGEDGKYGFSLLDLHSNQIKWTLPESNKVLGTNELEPFMPIWKPDASSMTYIWMFTDKNNSQNFYNISMDGQITPFTHFEEIFKPGYILYSQLQWSSDMHFMAFQVQKPDRPTVPELLIWDDISKTIMSPCLPVDGIRNGYFFDWSPDNKHIALSLSYSNLPTISGNSPLLVRNFILDIPNRVMYELPDAIAMRDYLELSGDVAPYSVGKWMNWKMP